MSESLVTWATSVPILVFLGLSVLELGPMYATDVRRQTDVRQKHRLIPPPYGGGGIINVLILVMVSDGTVCLTSLITPVNSDCMWSVRDDIKVRMIR